MIQRCIPWRLLAATVALAWWMCVGAANAAESVSVPLADLAAQIRAEWPQAPEPGPTHTNAESYLISLAPAVLRADVVSGNAPAVIRTNLHLLPMAVAYIQVGEVHPGLRTALEKSLLALSGSQTLAGTVLDLRFSGGSDVAAAVDAAGLFASHKSADLHIGTRTLVIERRGERTNSPVIVLVNGETRGAAEVLAAAVRSSAVPSLILGSKTAGQARDYRSITLPSGLRLRIADASLSWPEGSKSPLGGVSPDLDVPVPLADEKAYQTNEFRRVIEGHPAGSALTLRLNEAELVRRRLLRGSDPDVSPQGQNPRRGRRPLRSLHPEPVLPPDSPPVVQDPVLARALDLLSALSTPPPPSEGDSR